ncbi:MAG: asparaginase [Bdellovibrionaceae bacterium]|nr:asparaginase [Bdellovibrionales bacterium]MCB9254770.1 asparaginase [Pseudobdellovibrionaceae bacterium]
MHLSSLFSFYRNGVREISVTGEIVVSNGTETLFSTSSERLAFPARSLLKPFQFFAAGLDPQTWTGDPLYAAALGSISATAEQVEAFKQLPDRRRHLIPKLAIPNIGYPMDEAHREALKAQSIPPAVEYHSCFSKHLGILEACERNGWDAGTYNKVGHPYHEKLRDSLGALLGQPLRCEWVVDGCGLPSPVLELSQMAKLFQQLAKAESLSGIRNQMLRFPDWIGGPKRVDTRLMAENEGKVIAKEGADGLLGLSILPSTKYPNGLGIVCKLYGGYQPFLAGLAVAPLLEAVGLAAVGSIPAGQTIRYHYRPLEQTRCLDISPTVSARTAVFPGDVPFSREVSLDAEKGDHLTLSSCHTTLHVGAHADAPSHFIKGGKSIDAVSPDLYSGLCEVRTVTKKRGEVLEAKDLGEFKTRRVLLRTGSFPDMEHFNEDFVALSPELIKKLSESGMVLVGVDTPSLDPADSKTLAAHHATLNGKLAILEGLDLTQVEDGIYWLSASPLKLEGADASPVRALLTPLSW